jgi:hypothetical protein
MSRELFELPVSSALTGKLIAVASNALASIADCAPNVLVGDQALIHLETAQWEN